MIKPRYTEFIYRGKLRMYTKYSKEYNHLSNVKKHKLYNYYICDNCGCEFKVSKKNEGLITLHYTITQRPTIYLAICSKCVKAVAKEFNNSKGGICN